MTMISSSNLSCRQYECKLSPKDQEYAFITLQEDQTTRDAQLEEFRQWLHSKKYLNAHDDIKILLYFLRGCKFNQDRARWKAVNFYEMRSNFPEWFSNRDPACPHLNKILGLGVFLPISIRHPVTGCKVILIRAAVHDPKKILQTDIFKVSKMIMELVAYKEEIISIYGVHAIIDLSGVTLGHALQLTPTIIKKLVHAWQECYPIRTRSIDFINCPFHINVVLNVFRRFMSEKMRQRIHVHGRDRGALIKIIPPEITPEEYGGTGGKLSELIDFWRITTVECRERFLDDEKHKADMSLKEKVC